MAWPNHAKRVFLAWKPLCTSIGQLSGGVPQHWHTVPNNPWLIPSLEYETRATLTLTYLYSVMYLISAPAENRSSCNLLGSTTLGELIGISPKPLLPRFLGYYVMRIEYRTYWTPTDPRGIKCSQKNCMTSGYLPCPKRCFLQAMMDAFDINVTMNPQHPLKRSTQTSSTSGSALNGDQMASCFDIPSVPVSPTLCKLSINPWVTLPAPSPTEDGAWRQGPARLRAPAGRPFGLAQKEAFQSALFGSHQGRRGPSLSAPRLRIRISRAFFLELRYKLPCPTGH